MKLKRIVIAATKKDICLPNACLNSTICGLVSRTIFLKNKNKEAYHGAILLKEYKDQDYTNWFIHKISKKFHEPKESMIAGKVDEEYVPSVYQKLSEDFGVLEKTKVKLSIGESSRALIRRIPKIMLVKDLNNPDLSFVLEMAKKKGVPIRKYDTKEYECITILQ